MPLKDPPSGKRLAKNCVAGGSPVVLLVIVLVESMQTRWNMLQDLVPVVGTLQPFRRRGKHQSHQHISSVWQYSLISNIFNNNVLDSVTAAIYKRPHPRGKIARRNSSLEFP